MSCEISGERCGGLCTGYDGSKEWKKIDAAVDEIGCETCREEGKKLMSFAHDIVNLRIGKSAYDPKNFHEFVDIVNCVANSCKSEGKC